MNILVFLAALLLERSIGSSLLVVPLISVMLFEMEMDKLRKYSLFAGLLIDIFFGHTLGISSLLMLISSLEITLYKSKIESKNLWSLFLFGVLISVQAGFFWGTSESASLYFVHGFVATIIYVFYKKLSRTSSKGVYLRN